MTSEAPVVRGIHQKKAREQAPEYPNIYSESNMSGGPETAVNLNLQDQETLSFHICSHQSI